MWQRSLLPLAVNPDQATLRRDDAARDVDERAVRRHRHVGRAGRGRLHLGQNRRRAADDSEPGEVEGDCSKRSLCRV